MKNIKTFRQFKEEIAVSIGSGAVSQDAVVSKKKQKSYTDKNAADAKKLMGDKQNDII